MYSSYAKHGRSFDENPARSQRYGVEGCYTSLCNLTQYIEYHTEKDYSNYRDIFLMYRNQYLIYEVCSFIDKCIYIYIYVYIDINLHTYIST